MMRPQARILSQSYYQDRDIAFYARTSGNSQDERMQFDSIRPILDKKKDIRVFVDHGVSAAKVKMSERQKLMELLQEIKAGRVGELYVYHRDRLARDPYEYPIILNILYEYNVNVIFTASNTIPFSKDFVVEALFGMLAFQEAKHIQMRLDDAKKHNPPQIMGYVKQKTESGNLYIPDDRFRDSIQQLFVEITSAPTGSELTVILGKFQKKFNKSNIDSVLNIIKNPFYAGMYESNGHYLKLNHVTPLIDFKIWSSSNESIIRFSEEVKMLIKKTRPIVNSIVCGVCGQELKRSNKKLFCGRSHKRIEVSIDLLNDNVLQNVRRLVSRLNATVLKDVSLFHAKKELTRTSNQIAAFDRSLEKVSSGICHWEIENGQPSQHLIREFEDLEVKKNELIHTSRGLQQVINQLTDLSTSIEILRDKDVDFKLLEYITTLMVRRIILSHHEMDIEVYFTDLIDKGCAI